MAGDAGTIVVVEDDPHISDLVDLYPQFYWGNVSAQIDSAIRYLNVTSNGRQWIANLYSNVFRAERDLSQSGPQR